MNTEQKTHLIHDRDARGKTQIGWLDSRHTFSFGGFQDPQRMGFRTLRVINDDSLSEQLSRRKRRLIDERNCSRTPINDYPRSVF
jgi:hypothetical protein